MSVLIVLTNKEEEHVLQKLKKEARAQCADIIKEFVECSKVGTVRVWFACQGLNKQMNKCLSQYTTQEMMDQRVEEALKEKILWRKEERARMGAT
ncbi:hypothetical protein HDV00_012400 [Rhizophlyctis rosea]|nr:hypothetical protein HDV00_012400 [Rhizophlyctis rosea]